MGKFDTHGGHFAPLGYMKINEGGSHEENPNGGVQIGTDQNGIPNMLQQDETVYNDFVYSNEIYADKDMLSKFNIPTKYAGKPFSDIADTFVDEAAQRPNDPISNNGLNAMLVRLADAQEEQKAIKQQEELEKELASLTPEELEQLDAMLAQQEQPQEQMQPEMMQQPLIMACGGKMNRYDLGSELNIALPQDAISVNGAPWYANLTPEQQQAATASMLEDEAARQEKEELTSNLLSLVPVAGIPAGINDLAHSKSREDAVLNAVGLVPVIGGIGKGIKMAKAARAVSKVGKVGMQPTKRSIKATKKALDKMAKENPNISFSHKVATNTLPDIAEETAKVGTRLPHHTLAGHAVRAAVNPFYVGRRIWGSMNSVSPWLRYPATIAGGLVGASPASAVIGFGGDKAIELGTDLVNSNKKSAGFASDDIFEDFVNQKKKGGEIVRKFEGGSPGDYEPVSYIHDVNVYGNRPNDYITFGPVAVDTLQTPQFVSPQAIDNSRNHVGLIRETAVYGNRPQREITGSVETRDLGAVPVLPARTPSNNVYLGTPGLHGVLSKDYTYLLNPDYYFPGEDATDYSISVNPDTSSVELTSEEQAAAQVQAQAQQAVGQPTGTGVTAPRNEYSLPAIDWSIQGTGPKQAPLPGELAQVPMPTEAQGTPENADAAQMTAGAQRAMATFPRYAGAIASGITGLYNAFQKPDKYTMRGYNPVLPTGRLNLTNPVYNPLDQNQAINTTLASSAGMMRGLRNSGLGPSTSAVMLAADRNVGNALGRARTSVWDVNNQRRNDVIAQRNANTSAMSQFDMNLANARANALNQAQLYNAQNDLRLQQLNYGAEGQKYAAVQNQLDAMSQGLAGIGRENVAFNQINYDPAYNYMTGPTGVVAHRKRGGLLKTCKK